MAKFKKFSIRWRIFKGKVAHFFGRPHKHLFHGFFKGKVTEQPCLICGKTFHELGSGQKQV